MPPFDRVILSKHLHNNLIPRLLSLSGGPKVISSSTDSLEDQLSQTRITLSSLKSINSKWKGDISSAKLSISSSIDLDKESRRLNTQFTQLDLKRLDEGFIDAVTDARSYIKQSGLFGMFFNNIANDTESILIAHESTRSGEFTLHYAAGRFNEGVTNLFTRIKASLSLAANLNYKFIAPFEKIVDFVEMQTPAPGSAPLDPTLLKIIPRPSNTVWKNQLDALINRTVIYEIATLAAGLFATHLGVPAVMSVPLTLAACLGGVGFMRYRFGRLNDLYFNQLTIWHKRVKSQLQIRFDREFEKMLNRPCVSIMDLCQRTIDDCARMQSQEQTELEEIEREIDQLEAKLKPTRN